MTKREYHKKWKQSRSSETKQRDAFLKKKRKQSIRERYVQWQQQQSCMDCGEDNFIVLELDHVRGKKKSNVSDMIRNGYSWERILEEINKCESVCANCHRIRTAIQFNWYKDVIRSSKTNIKKKS